MAGALDFAGMVPGFDFLQNLMKGAGASLPPMGQWVAPTLDPVELEKRIGELRTVQFWLEQNAKLLGTTIQAMEVQRMTLATLKTMNLPMADLRESLKAVMPSAAAPAGEAKPPAGAKTTDAAPPAIDPMQWWGALTQQFTEIASKALKDNPAEGLLRAAAAAAPQAAVSSGSAGKTAAKRTARKAATAPRARRPAGV